MVRMLLLTCHQSFFQGYHLQNTKSLSCFPLGKLRSFSYVFPYNSQHHRLPQRRHCLPGEVQLGQRTAAAVPCPQLDVAGIPVEITVSELFDSSAEVLGKGSLGTAYKCMREDGSIVAVKRLKKGIILRNLKQQLADMVKLKHENLVPLLAYLHTEDEKLLVSEYMTNGSCLADRLHGDDRYLDWDTRVRVALGAANGISYLHDHGYTHGNIKSSNILLTDNDNCVLSDYGIAELVGVRAEEVCYGAPDGRITKQADVYSYGMLLLELLTGENPAISHNGQNLWLWVQSREEQIEIFKSLLFRYPDKKEEMVHMLQIASECVGLYCLRPTMKQVVNMVENLKKTRY